MTPAKLDFAKNHSIPYIVELSQYVEQAINDQSIPNALPTQEYLQELLDNEFGNLVGEDQNIAYHLLWYIKELHLGRLPTIKNG